jgi:hypothetical protein
MHPSSDHGTWNINHYKHGAILVHVDTPARVEKVLQ